MKLLIGVVVVFISACATKNTPEKQLTDPVSVENDVKVSKKAKVGSQKKTAISPEVMYLLLAAEIAGQRHQYGVALDGYLKAARQVKDVRVAERAAKIGLYLKDTDKTDEAVELWLKHDEKNLTARKIAVLSALRGEDKNEAVSHVSRLLEDDPAGFEPTLMEVVKVIEKEGNSQFILDVLADVSQKYPDQAVVSFVQALFAADLNQISLANDKVDQALELQPEWNKALILRAQLAVKANKLDQAQQDLQTVLKEMPENQRVRRMLGQVYVKKEQYTEALDEYERILEIEPDDAEARFSMALIYLQLEEDEQAKEQFNQLVNKSRWDAPASFYLGRLAFKQKEFDNALVWFDKVTYGPYEYDASIAAVTVLMNQKKYDLVEQRIDKLLQKFPKQKLNVSLLKSEALNAQKKYQQAYDELTDALNEFPANREILYTRALIAEKLDKLEIVESDLLKVIELNPNDANALNALGYTLVDRTDRYQEAEQYLTKAIKLKPGEAVIIDSLGWLKFKQGKHSEALKLLREAYEKLNEGEIAAHLVEVLLSIGETSEAEEIFNQAFERSPDNEYLLKIKNKF